MKLLLSLLFTFTFQAQAAEYLIYSSQNEQIKAKFNGVEVFSQKEKAFLKKTKVDTSVIKVNFQDEKQLQFFKRSYPNAKIEINNKIELFSTEDPFEKFQWALNNKGETLEDWASDIDVIRTQGVIGEDIQIDNQEKRNKVLVAIIDSGLDTTHPDLKEHIYTDAAECKSLEEYNTCLNTTSDKDICHEKFKDVDHNGNGYPMDCHGWNITGKTNPQSDLEGSGSVNDNNGHGTHVAGIIGAKKNGIGVRGVIQNVTLLPVQVSVASQSNSATSATDKFAKALLYAIKNNAQVVNMSLGWRFEQDSILMREMIKLAFEKGMLVVAAAGNDHHAGPTYPCSYEEVICVGAHTVNGALSSFSNYGAHVDIMAPGTRILSTWPTTKRSRSFTIDDDYEYLSGTSQAAPYVTGVLARLLNQGLSSEQARVALLKGARKVKRNTENFIRHGNIDYKNALKQKFTGFLYPKLKSPSLVKWDKEINKVIKFKLQNYLTGSKNVKAKFELIQKETQMGTSLTKSIFNIGSMKASEEKEITLELKSPYDVDGNFVIKTTLESDTEKKSYYFQAKALSLITPDTQRDDQESFEMLGNVEFTKDAVVRAFKDYSNETLNDFLVTKVVNNKTHIALLRSDKGSYTVTKDFPLPMKEPVIINLSKVDLELDGKYDYVITVVNIIDRENRETKFLALDENFKPKRIEISPKNTFKNDITVLPGSFYWLKYQQRMVPAWITFGERPENERPTATPWSDAPIETKVNRLYLQLKEGIKTISFDEDEELPLHFLYQSPKNKQAGKAILISSVGYGYFKRYKLYEFDETLKYLQDVKMERFLDLASARPLPVSQPENTDHAFFNTPSILGNQNVVAIQYNSDTNELRTINRTAQTMRETQRIKFVLSFSQEAMMAQTSSYLISQGDAITYGPSKTDSRRIKHHILVGNQGLFLASALTPGIGSELVMPHPESKSLYRPAGWQNLGVKGCSEVGFTYENSIDKLVYMCSESSKLFKFQF